MTIDEFLERRHGAFESRRYANQPIDAAPVYDVVAYNGLIICTARTREVADVIATILNDAWSRHPREGERRCGTCRWMTQDIELGEGFVNCSALGPSVDYGDRSCDFDPETTGTTCPVWQRKETKP